MQIFLRRHSFGIQARLTLQALVTALPLPWAIHLLAQRRYADANA